MSDLSFLDGVSRTTAMEGDGAGNYDPLPPGEYRLRIASAEVTDTNNGKQIKLECDVEGPTHAGRKVWARLNVHDTRATFDSDNKPSNNYGTMVSIGRRDFARLGSACGFDGDGWPSMQYLKGRTFTGKLKIKPARTINKGTAEERTFEATNELIGFAPPKDLGNYVTQKVDDIPF